VTAPAGRPEVRRLSIRVALAATAVVAAVYLVISVAVVAYVTGSLTAQVDNRLARTLEHVGSDGPPPVDEPMPRPDEEGPFGPTRAMWIIGPNGTVGTDQEVDLPEEHRDVTEPTTIALDGAEIRIVGKDVGEYRIVVGESLEPVNDAGATIILGELLVAPVLLIAVFVGAVAIGRRVATPIEAARQRQLEFTADASHELRTPLAVIEANASLALAQDRNEEWYRTAFGKVDSESKRMRRMLDDLLWLARFDATRKAPSAEPVDLGILATQAADRFAPVAESKRLALRVEAPREGAVVSASPEWLDRLLGVLLDNACKYSPHGGTVMVQVASQRGRVVLTVDDSGPGIPEDQRERIFDRFHRATDRAGGAGLGLAIGDAVVRATGGKWTIGDAPGGGARMSVSWPRSGPGSAQGEVEVRTA
jgi:two-component system, OmpR family, sensor histidine kinase CiaH